MDVGVAETSSVEADEKVIGSRSVHVNKVRPVRRDAKEHTWARLRRRPPRGSQALR